MLSPDIEQIIAHIYQLSTAYNESVKHTRGAPAPTFLLDGPSGAGKTTLSAELEKHWNSAVKLQIVHMDDLYPGWNGLLEGVSTAARMLNERSAGQDTHWQQYDWSQEKLTQWHSVDAREPLLIEGCGALPQGAQNLSQVRLWLDADTELRRERALSRTGENFAEHWSDWDAQFEEYMRIHNPQSIATLQVRSTE